MDQDLKIHVSPNALFGRRGARNRTPFTMRSMMSMRPSGVKASAVADASDEPVGESGGQPDCGGLRGLRKLRQDHRR
ncbi:MAG: hypothetical protein M3338_00400 [Actinomycetota bacterium]|nr:hypothetical protein [Actinomycetota bacterium]